MGSDRENLVPGNLCIIWQLNKAWPLKGLGHFFTALKAFKTQKEFHQCPTTFKVFNTEKSALSLSWNS